MAEPPLTGRLLAAGRPQARGVVLLLDGEARGVQARTATDEDGGFALPRPEAGSILLARGRDAALGAIERSSAPTSGPVELELPEPLWPLTVRAEGDVPDALELRLTPVSLDGVADDLLRRADELGEGVVLLPLGSGVAERRVQQGRWRLDAGALELNEPFVPGVRSRLWRTTGARNARRVADGWEIDVCGPADVVLEIEVREGD